MTQKEAQPGHSFISAGRVWTAHAKIGDFALAESGLARPRRFHTDELGLDISPLPDLHPGDFDSVDALFSLCTGPMAARDIEAALRRHDVTRLSLAAMHEDLRTHGHPFVLFPARSNPLVTAVLTRKLEPCLGRADQKVWRDAWAAVVRECENLRYRPPSWTRFNKLAKRYVAFDVASH